MTINEAGIHPLLMVAGIIRGALHPLDKLILQDAEIVLLGPADGRRLPGNISKTCRHQTLRRKVLSWNL